MSSRQLLLRGTSYTTVIGNQGDDRIFGEYWMARMLRGPRTYSLDMTPLDKKLQIKEPSIPVR